MFWDQWWTRVVFQFVFINDKVQEQAKFCIWDEGLNIFLIPRIFHTTTLSRSEEIINPWLVWGLECICWRAQHICGVDILTMQLNVGFAFVLTLGVQITLCNKPIVSMISSKSCRSLGILIIHGSKTWFLSLSMFDQVLGVYEALSQSVWEVVHTRKNYCANQQI